jgi:chromosomal replication initiation ATPase DnaA
VISAEEILSATARHLDCDRNNLLTARRGRGADNVGRMIAMKLCQQLGSMKLSAIAELFGVTSDNAISPAIDRFNQTLSTDRRLEKMFNRMYQDLTH